MELDICLLFISTEAMLDSINFCINGYTEWVAEFEPKITYYHLSRNKIWQKNGQKEKKPTIRMFTTRRENINQPGRSQDSIMSDITSRMEAVRSKWWAAVDVDISRFNKHIGPALGDSVPTELVKMDITRFRRDLEKKGLKTGNGIPNHGSSKTNY